MALTDVSNLTPEMKAAADPQGQDTLSAGPTPAPSATAPPDMLPLSPNAAGPGLTALSAPPPDKGSFSEKIMQAAGKLGIAPGPSGWAKSLVGGAQSALSGPTGTTAGDIQNANESLQKSNPYGGAGVIGVLGAQQNARNARVQAAKVAQTAEDRERGQIAYTNAQTMLQEQTLHALKGKIADQANDEAIKNGLSSYNMAVTAPAAFGLEPAKVIKGGGGTAADISEQDLQKALNDGTWDPTKEQYAATSTIPSMDGNKPRLDAEGNQMREKRYTIFTTPPTVKLSQENADFLNANIPGSHWEKDQPMPGAAGLMLFQQANNAHAQQAAQASALEEADIKLARLEHSKAQDDAKKALAIDPDYQKAWAHVHGLENLALFVTGQVPTGRLIPEIGPDGKPTGKTVPEIDKQSADYAASHPNGLQQVRDSFGYYKDTGESVFDKTLADQQEKEALAREKAAAGGDKLPKTLEDATAQLVAAKQSGDPQKIKNAQEQRDAAISDKVKESAEQARQVATASGKDVEAMVKTGINPITKERLNLLNAPDAALVDRHGLAVPTDMVHLYAPSGPERVTADTARTVLAISADLRQQLATHPDLIGPLMGRSALAVRCRSLRHRATKSRCLCCAARKNLNSRSSSPDADPENRVQQILNSAISLLTFLPH
jgi:hypothetical protein